MIIRIALYLLAIAVVVLVSADIMLELSMPMLPELTTDAGLALLLVGFALLLAYGLAVLGKQSVAAVADYCSRPQRLQRKALFIAARQQRLKRLLHFKTDYLAYVHEQRRKRLLDANNRKHIKALAKAIDKQLRMAKKHLARPTYRQWQQQLRYYQHQQDADALLRLQQQIEALDQP